MASAPIYREWYWWGLWVLCWTSLWWFPKVYNIHISKRRERKWLDLPCTHGVTGGENDNKCTICSHQKQNEDLAKKELQEIQRQNKINAQQLEVRLLSHYQTTLAYYRRLDPYDFEKKVAELFNLQGHSVHVTSKVGDEGKDIILSKGNETTYVECKRYARGTKVSRPDAQKLAGAMAGDGVRSGIIVTTSDFTDDCRKWVRESRVNIELIDASRFLQMLEKHLPRTDYPAEFLQRCDILITSRGESDQSQTVPKPCGCEVRVSLPSSAKVNCPNGHELDSIAYVIESRLNPKNSANSALKMRLCPKCGERMVKRKARQSRKKFWGCSKWPACNGYRAL